MMDFAGKYILITGASSGIGRACAVEFARRGGCVAVHYRSSNDAARSTLMALEGTGHTTVAADIADPTSVESMIEHVLDAFGRIDVLINNASSFEAHSPTEVDYATWCSAWMRTLSTNLMGAANVSYCVAQSMITVGGGRIVNISSSTAFRGSSNAPAYAASYAALNALGQNLALAYAPHNIYVYTIAPGVVETDAVDHDNQTHAWETLRKQSPLGRAGTPEEVARTAAFLAAPGAEMLTGGIIDINGAAYLRT